MRHQIAHEWVGLRGMRREVTNGGVVLPLTHNNYARSRPLDDNAAVSQVTQLYSYE